MADFFAELKRRQIYRVGAAYVVVAWALTQVIDVLSQVFELASWMAQTAIVLLAIGFPIALLVAWTIENKPHEAVAAAVRSKPTVLDGALFGSLIIVSLLIGYQQLAPTRQPGIDAARSASLNPAGAISLAVLPFSNLSSDPEQEFFSDGMTEEITAALAKVPDLRVVGRTSAFQFKGQNQDLRAIGQALSASI
jgi:adenylate cyclase